MELAIKGEETIEASAEALWEALNDPEVLTRCIPGCKQMIPEGEDAYRLEMELKVTAVRGSFGGDIALSNKVVPQSCDVTVSGSGSLGTGTGKARFELVPVDSGTTQLLYEGSGEVGGLVAGVGQRVLKSVSKHLIGKFFTALKKDFAAKSDQAA
ncbi:CoxG family protein [Roseovarius sp. CH_XMU1461]|uniref:CoxG family protein n=1 Tax=Roseovarius sp. CH_XMU1461 TaxID=3107777 RepID=UPI003008C6B0